MKLIKMIGMAWARGFRCLNHSFTLGGLERRTASIGVKTILTQDSALEGGFRLGISYL